MSRIVRQSKYRHVFGTVAKREDCYDELRVTRSAWDSNFVAANAQYWAVIAEAGGGGAFMVAPHKQTGKWDAKAPMITGHKNAVLDLDFHPFNESLVASASEDCTVKIWGIPEGGLKENMTEALQTLTGHRRKVGTIKFHPSANNILASTGADFSVKIWEVEKGKDVLSIDAQHGDIIQSADWSLDGSLLCTSCKDKKLRVLDPRTQKVAQEVDGHAGVKGSRVCFLGTNKIFSVGFTKTSEREYALWDPRDLSKRLNSQSVDSASGILMPFFDSDTKVLFLAGKGDGNIRYYEIVDEAPYIHYLSEFKSSTPQRGMGALPKRAMNVSECEIARLLKLGVKTLEPISFQVPRKSDMFQDDIFPDCASGEPSLTSDEYLAGQNALPKTMSLAPGFVQKKVVQEFNPVVNEVKPLSEKELREEYEKLKNRVAFLEAELVKKDAKIKELQSGSS